MRAVLVLLVVISYAFAQPTTQPPTTLPPTTSPAAAPGCYFAINTTKCRNLAGAQVPLIVNQAFNTTNFDPDAFYEYLGDQFCETCDGQLIGKKWICSFMLSIYALNGCPTTGVTQRISCRSACEATIGQGLTAKCTQGNTTDLPSVPCTGSAWGSDDAGDCDRNNFGGDLCTRPPFLNRKTANVPNWFWVILFPLLILIIAVAIIGVILYRMKHDQLAETLNPCKWCECCPGYWDL